MKQVLSLNKEKKINTNTGNSILYYAYLGKIPLAFYLRLEKKFYSPFQAEV
jgi:hypothetical protein